MRVHAESPLPNEIGARAFAHQQHVVFAPGEYRPGTPQGDHLIGHELAHVVQQAAAGDGELRASGLARDHHEREADAAASLALAGRRVQALSPAVGRSVQRQPQPGPPTPAIAPINPPGGPPSADTTFELSVPQLSAAGSLLPPLKRRVVLAEAITRREALVFYAIPRAALTPATAVSRADSASTVEELPRSVPLAADERDRLLSSLGPKPIAGAPATPAAPAPPAAVEAFQVRGDYVITTRYSKLAVGAGSVAVLESKSGITLLDAGVAQEGRAALSAAIVDEVAGLVGDRAINEVLVSHLHADHTSLLPELARRFRIEKIRINALQLSDPRMIELLEKVANAQRLRIADEVKKRSATLRAEFENDPARGKIAGDPTLREAAWKLREQQLIEEAVKRSGIVIDQLTAEGGAIKVRTQPVAELKLPVAEGKPVTLSQGHLEVDEATGRVRISTAQPELSTDLRALADRQKTDPKARAEDPVVDRNEATYVIQQGAVRFFVLPDKRAPTIEKMQSLLASDVQRMNQALATLGLPQATLQVWETGHHMQRGYIASVGQMEAMIQVLWRFTRVPLAGGGRTADIVVVSGEGDAAHPRVGDLVDPTTAMFLEQNGLRVIVADPTSVRVLEVLTPGGKALTGVAGATPFPMAFETEAFLRQSASAVAHIDKTIDALKRTKPPQRGLPRADYLEKVKAINESVGKWSALKTEIERARRAYLEQMNAERTPQGTPVTKGGAGASPELLKRLQALRSLLADPRLSDVPVEPGAGAGVGVFDPVALYLLNEPTGGFTAEQRAVVDAVKRAEAARSAVLSDQGDLEKRAKLIEELAKLQGSLSEYAEKAPPGTKELITERIGAVKADIERVVSAGGGEAPITTERGGYTVTQRTSVSRTGGDRARAIADKATRPLGALMIYSVVRRQGKLEASYRAGDAGELEHFVGTAHNAYGFSIGVRMLSKTPVGLGEFAILAVLDFTETASRSYATEQERDVAMTYSAIRNTLQLAVAGLGMWMMRSPNGYVAAAGFLMQFAVDPLLDAIGAYDWVERSLDFLPNDVVLPVQRLRDLLKTYAVAIGLLELQERGGSTAEAQVSAGLKKHREKTLALETDFLKALAEGYQKARTSYAGLPELDLLRERFLSLQARAHADDADYGATSRRRIIDALDGMEASMSLDKMSAEDIGGMEQWSRIDDKIGEVSDAIDGSPNWEKAAKRETELTQMLRNARYRLDPGPSGLRPQAMLTPGSAAEKAYQGALAAREAKALALHHRLSTMAGICAPAPVLGQDAGASTIQQAQLAIAAFRSALTDVPPLTGLTPSRLESNSVDAGPNYTAYVADHDDYRSAIAKLATLEQVMVSSLQLAVMMNKEAISIEGTDPRRTELDRLRADVNNAIRDRRARNFLFAHEASQRAATLREAENQIVSAQVGDTSQPYSPNELAAISAEGLPHVDTFSNRLAKVPYLAVAGADGYMVGVYRYVDDDTPASANVLVGDLRRRENLVVLDSDATMPHLVFVPLNAAAQRKFPGGEAQLRDGMFDRPWSHLKPVKLSEVKP